MPYRCRWIVGVLTFMLLQGNLSEAMDIVVEGKPMVRIVVPSTPTATEQFAATELQHYLSLISGTELVIEPEDTARSGPAIYIGRTSLGRPLVPALAADDPDTFTVRTQAGDLILVGAGDRATLYAVYDFLEDDLGCRWLGPGPRWEVVPPRETIRFNHLNRTESPAMKYRFLRMIVPAKPRIWAWHTTSWAVKQKINIATGWPPEEMPVEFEKRGGFKAWMKPHEMIPNLLPAKEHFEEHPEWYAMIDGKRRRSSKGWDQLCTTNPEVVERIAGGLNKVFDARPEMDFMAMGQADGTTFCECDQCTALDTGELWTSGSVTKPVITERWFQFVNAVARKLRETSPGEVRRTTGPAASEDTDCGIARSGKPVDRLASGPRKVYSLAYHQTFRPPAPGTMRLEPNVMVQVVNSRPNYVCFVHRLENAACPHHEKFRRALEDWIAIAPGGVMVYEYAPHSTFCNMPYPAARKFVDDIRYLHRMGVVGYEGQSSVKTWGTYALPLYAIAKATWDPTVDADWLVRDYCDHAFGRASGAVQEFIATIDRGLVAADHITDGIWSYMTPQVMAEARRHLDAAHQTAIDPAVKYRLGAFEINFHYGELASQAWREAERAIAEKDAVRLQQAIKTAEAAAAYCAEQQKIQPNHAAAGKLSSLYIPKWKRALAEMVPE